MAAGAPAVRRGWAGGGGEGEERRKGKERAGEREEKGKGREGERKEEKEGIDCHFMETKIMRDYRGDVP